MFDPDNIHHSEHILNVDETEFPKKYREIIRRLRKAAESEEMREIMHVEDEVFEELAAGERAAEERDRALALINEKDNALAEKERTIAENRKSLAEKDQQLIRTVLHLHKTGQSTAGICEITGLAPAAVAEIINPPPPRQFTSRTLCRKENHPQNIPQKNPEETPSIRFF